jgi:transcription elongation factor B subunit 1
MSDEESEYVTLVSCDGFEFVVKRSAAVISGTIKRMLNPRSTSLHEEPEHELTFADRFQEVLTNRCVFGELK